MEEKLIDGFFEAAADPELWPAVLHSLSDLVGGSTVNLVSPPSVNAPPLLNYLVRNDQVSYHEYLSHYMFIDPRIPRIQKQPRGQILLEDDLLTPEERMSDPTYNESLVPHGMRNLAVVRTTEEDLFTVLAVAPHNDAIPFTPEQLAQLQRLLKPLHHAVKLSALHQDLRLQRDALGDLWSNSGRAILILNSFGAVVHLNALAEKAIEYGLIAVNDQTLHFCDPATDLLWTNHLAASNRPNAPRISNFLANAPFGNDSIAVRLIMDPITIGKLGFKGAAKVLVTLTPLGGTLKVQESEILRFAQLFNISPAEALTVEAVAKGRNLDELAAERNISLDTARKQLKAAMFKCGVNTQKALITRLERFCFLTLNADGPNS